MTDEQIRNIVMEKFITIPMPYDVALARAIIAAHTEELCQGVEMPEPKESGYSVDGEEIMTYRMEDIRATVAAARAKNNALWQKHYDYLESAKDALTAEFDALAAAVGWTKERCEQTGDSPLDCAKALIAELAKKDAEIASFKRVITLQESGMLEVNTALTAERDALQAKYEALRQAYGLMHGGSK